MYSHKVWRVFIIYHLQILLTGADRRNDMFAWCHVSWWRQPWLLNQISLPFNEAFFTFHLGILNENKRISWKPVSYKIIFPPSLLSFPCSIFHNGTKIVLFRFYSRGFFPFDVFKFFLSFIFFTKHCNS